MNIKSRHEFISKKVERILDEHKIAAPEVDVIKIANERGISVEIKPLSSDLSGFCLKNEKGSFIVINSHQHDISEKRSRFTVAHELGHLMLHCHDNNEEEVFVDKTVVYRRDKASSSGEIKKEIEANAFAAELLMPRPLLDKELDGEFFIGEDRITDLATKFNVSEQAMTFRLTNLGYVM